MSDVSASNVVQTSPLRRIFGAAGIAVWIVAIVPITLKLFGYWKSGWPQTDLLISPLLIWLALQWSLWPDTFAIDDRRVARILGTILFLVATVSWVRAILKFVSE